LARTYRLTPLRRVANVLMRLLLRLDLAPRTTMLLTVPARRGGTPRSTPVTLVEEDGQRWLVAPYGPVGWVHNARAAGHVELSRGRRTEMVRVKELAPEAAAAIIKAYVERVPITRAFFDVPRTHRLPRSRPRPRSIPSSRSTYRRLVLLTYPNG
jgi:deazaflavin-dependent oxidoreductase (nitroreductase family)